MIRLLYISSATKPMSDAELLALLEECRRNNNKEGITGMLLYCGESFIQVLEGKEQDIETLFKTIKKDPRHSNVTVLEKKHITERKFPEWSMGFKQLSDADLQNIEGLNRFFDNEIQADYFIHEQNIVALLMQHFRKKCQAQMAHIDLPTENVSPLMEFLHKTIITAVKVLAILMALVILLGVWDVMYVIYEKLIASPVFQLEIGDILQTFGAFMAVLIAIEIFINITLYLRTDIIPVRLVVATALMAICRKIIVFDFHDLTPQYVYASGVVVLGLGITYWLVENIHDKHDKDS
ncbi:MAG: phosphate-starvation-inducible PsiE family protein [Gammaproteobacteria bacterium]